ncbi:hypothetical protein JHK85_010308 [Glycine max]|nr:hypothetical protein JHK85_010308 [Glycine max]KAG5066299.1 hypothetical protein JHK86_010030 [Glycine max]
MASYGDGMLRQPKWGHLKELHAVVKSYSTTLLEGKQNKFSLGQLLETIVAVPVKAWGVVQCESRKKVNIMKEHEFVILCINEFVQEFSAYK